MSVSYDLSPLYRHSTSTLIASHGALESTVLSCHGTKLILRSTATSRIIRTWSLGSTPLSISVSPSNPDLILAYSLGEGGWILDATRDDPVAKFDIGKVEGCSHLAWDPNDPDSILVWADHRLRVSILSLKDPRTIYQIQSPKFAASHSYSFSDTYFALLERHEHRDCIAIYSPSDSWCLLRSIVIQDPTSDLVGLKWSPDGGHYLAAWSSVTHYYVHIYTPDGRLIKSFDPYKSLASSTTAATPKPTKAASKSAATPKATLSPIPSEPDGYVGLGIRTVEWSLDGQFLAIGGYDGKIRILSKVVNWEVVSELTCPNKILATSSTSIWREPAPGWVEKTLGKGIITFDRVEPTRKSPYLNHANDFVQPDATRPFPKMGWSKLVWSRNGHFLVGHNQSYPNHLYVFEFLKRDPDAAEESQRLHIRPRLHTLIVLNSTVKTFQFKPVNDDADDETLIVLSGSKSFTVWSSTAQIRPEGEGEVPVVVVEGIGIPTSDATTFNPNSLEFLDRASTGEQEEVIMVGEKGGMFCLVYPVDGSVH